jgi:AGCS family alanine or glycine:cation symporter
MFVSGIISIVISYAENFIVLLYRKKDSKEGYFGGAMYVLDDVLEKRKLAIIFAVIVIISALTSGTMTQANSLSEIVNNSTNLSKKTVGIMLATITTYVVCGGKHRIAKLSSVVIPICSLVYITLCTVILFKNYANILPGFKEIISVAFGSKQIIGGVVGLGINKVIGKGFSIGVFSNEAGMGTAPMFTAAVENKDIHKASLVASLSVVIDTLFLCMLTGITIISTGKYNIVNPGELLNSVFGEIVLGEILLNVCMVFFVLATIPCLEYYAEQAIRYLTKNKLAIYIFLNTLVL